MAEGGPASSEDDVFIRSMLKQMGTLEYKTKIGLNPLMEAASEGDVEFGLKLLDHGADANATSANSSRDTALAIASANGHLEYVKLLLERGARADVKTSEGNSPLCLATNGGHWEVVELLRKDKADKAAAEAEKLCQGTNQ